MNNFSYKEYESIINHIGKHLPIVKFVDVTNDTKEYCVIRHDVEFSLERAYELSLIERGMGIKSSYMIQCRSNIYNILSNRNVKYINGIMLNGHNIGLHIHTGNYNDYGLAYMEDYIQQEIMIFEEVLGICVYTFCFHRPSKKLLLSNIQVPDMINTYDEKFFQYSEDLNDLKIKYISDSNHKWKYGTPFDIDFDKHKKVQLLCHPYSWSKDGMNNFDNLKVVRDDKIEEIKESMYSELKTYPINLL